MTCRSEVQLTLDGREERVPVALTAVAGSGQGDAPALFDTGAFAPRVPGTLPLDLDAQRG